MPKKIKAIIFDFDGTLLNTYEFVTHTIETTLAAHGVRHDREYLDTFSGQTLSAIYVQLLPGRVEEALQMHRDTQKSAEARALLRTFEQATELLERLQAESISCAILSNRLQPSLSELLEHAGLHDKFELVFGGNELPAPKPNPASVRLICDSLGVEEQETIIIGDTAVDVLTGKNSSLRASVGITHGFGSRAQLEEAGADYIVDSLIEFEDLIKRLCSDKD